MSLTGSDEKPPGKVAENWSRRDRIRAGAVSGPWRSAARDDTGERPVPPTSARKPPVPTSGRTLPLDWLGKSGPAPGTRPATGPAIHDPASNAAVDTALGAPVPQEPPTSPASDADVSDKPESEKPGSGLKLPPNRAIPDERRGRVTPTPRSNMIPMIAAAGLVAVAIVVAAALLRPDAPRSPDTASPETAGSASIAIDLPTMRLRVGPGFPPERQSEIMDLLAGAGHDDVLIERIPFSIAVSRVGYYRPEDRAAATDLARLVSSVLDEPTGTIAVRDYAELIPDAVAGRLDLWIGDREGQ